MLNAIRNTVILLAALLLVSSGVGIAQEGANVERQSLALTYPQGPTIGVKFRGTSRLPRASGEAKVERKRGTTEIEVELDEMKPARYFGGDYNTYVLWVVSPEGHVDNLGEFILNGNRTKLNTTTTLETFGMFVTAEPHFLVSSPSRFVVLENSSPTNNLGNLKTSRIRYRGYEGIYNFWRESLADVPETREKVRPHVSGGRTAVELARRAGAETFAPEEFAAAQKSLQEAENAMESGIGERNLMLLGHQTVRIAVEAEKLAQERAFQAALDAERAEKAREIEGLENAIGRARSQAEKARLEAEQRELELRMEQRARSQAMADAESAARRAAEAEQRASLFRDQANRAQTEAERAKAERDRAQLEAERKQRELTEAQKNMRAALSKVVEIRDTTRGLILNLPDILFDFDKATLKPGAREIVSRLAGILLVTQGYTMNIEGHTDSVGSDAYNLKLSQKRAQAVADYLTEASLGERILTVEGFGESRPVVENDTPKNRAKNRRVEIVIQESASPELP